MELFPPLTGFYKSIAEDSRISSAHISIYMALLQQWNLNGGVNPFTIERDLIMKASKISARHTYNRCMKHLHEFRYISYEPSANGSVKSIVVLKHFEIEK